MPKKIPAKPKASVLFLPLEFVKDIINLLASAVINRPIFTIFMCSSITALYLILSCPKAQRAIASFPYERFLSYFKSQKMIIVYATVVEVALELLMAVVLAGVSVIITAWLAFEEMADRKKYQNKEGVSYTESMQFDVFETSVPS